VFDVRLIFILSVIFTIKKHPDYFAFIRKDSLPELTKTLLKMKPQNMFRTRITEKEIRNKWEKV
jgi:hypothetical protein